MSIPSDPPPDRDQPGQGPPPGQDGFQYGEPSGQPSYPPPTGPPGYGPPGYGTPPPGYAMAGAPGYPGYPQFDPATGQPLSDKTKLVAGLLNIFIAGVGRMYMGHVGIGVTQLIVAIVTCGLGALWSLIDGILILINGGYDGQGRKLRDQ